MRNRRLNPFSVATVLLFSLMFVAGAMAAEPQGPSLTPPVTRRGAPKPPVVSLEVTRAPFVQIHVDTSAGEFVNVYRGATPSGPWVKIIDHFPTSARTAVDYLDRTSSGTMYYASAAIDDEGVESAHSASASVDLGSAVEALRASVYTATATSTYDKNNIISDAQLLNSGAMTASAIQSFLTSRGSVLANLTFNGSSAAQIIYNACQTNGISPYVVLTTLHKEQSLIGSSTTNLQARLNWAMGWGASSNFTDQVNNGTRQFKLYYNNLGNYSDVAHVTWRVGQLQTVYDGTVIPANIATAGLYIYTPWIGEGGGGRAGVGGNYLFWNIWYNVFSFGGGSGTASPSAPTNLSAVALSSSSIKFSWTDTSTNETNFAIGRWNGSEWIQIATLGANATSYTDTGLQASTTYYYTVCALNSVGTACASSYTSAMTLGTVTATLLPPTNLTAAATSSSSIKFSWTDNSTNESSFAVGRWNGSAWVQIGTTGANVTSFTDSGLAPSTTYYYTVCAQNTSNVACASMYTSATTLAAVTTILLPPSNLTAVAASSSSIKLSWSDNSSNESNFAVARWNGSAWIQIATTGANVTSYTDDGLAPSTTYYYTVCAENTSNDACASMYTSATTTAATTSLAAPTNLSATGLSSSSIRLSWSDNATNETNYAIGRWNGSAWVQIGTVGANVTSYTNSGLQPSTTYYYTVCAMNTSNVACASSYTSAATLNATSTTLVGPSGLSAVATSSSSIRIAWLDNSTNETTFAIGRWNGSAWVQVGSVGANITSYNDGGLQSHTTYYYVVCALNTTSTTCGDTYVYATTP